VSLFLAHLVYCGSNSLSVACVVDITFHRDDTYKVIVGDEQFKVQDVSLVETDNKTILSCDVNGRTSRSNVMFSKDTIHLFTLVCALLLHYMNSKPCNAGSLDYIDSSP